MKNFISLLTLCLVTCTLSGQYLERIAITSYEEIWSDAGTENPKDLIIWHPKNVPAGYFVFGSIATNGDNPNGKYTTYAYRTSAWHAKSQPSNKNLVRAATGFRKLWDDSGSGADRDVSFWIPTCDAGWVAVGVVANNTHSKPSVSNKNCGCIMNSGLFLVSVNDELDYTWLASECDGYIVEETVTGYKSGPVSDRRLFAKTVVLQFQFDLKSNLAFVDADFDGFVYEVESQGETYNLDPKSGRVFIVTDPNSWRQVAQNVERISTVGGRVKLYFKDGTECVDGAADAPYRDLGLLRVQSCFNTVLSDN